MNLIPVIDIRNGVAVHAVAGHRARYQPVRSRLTDSIEPAEVLRVLQREFQCGLCYVADLDAIERHQPNRCVLAEMSRTGVHLLVDAGIKTVDEIEDLQLGERTSVVVSSESFFQLDQLPRCVARCGAAALTFSVDLKHGRLQVADPSWASAGAEDIMEYVVEAGVEQIIVLDLAAVGTGTGIPTLTLCQRVKDRWPHLKIISGGGVNSRACLFNAQAAGLDGLLVASALHDGRLTADDIALVRSVGASRPMN